jgi:hypothetical protein
MTSQERRERQLKVLAHRNDAMVAKLKFEGVPLDLMDRQELLATICYMYQQVLDVGNSLRRNTDK